MVKKVLIIVKDAPYGSVFAAEALRAGIAFAGMDLDTNLIFIDDGIFCLMKKQKPEVFGMTGLAEGFDNANEFGLKIFAHKESLSRRSVKAKDVIRIKTITDNEIRELIEESDVIINL